MQVENLNYDRCTTTVVVLLQNNEEKNEIRFKLTSVSSSIRSDLYLKYFIYTLSLFEFLKKRNKEVAAVERCGRC